MSFCISRVLTASASAIVLLTIAAVDADAARPRSCSFNGQSIPNGSSTVAYESTTVPYGETCDSQVRTCTNGTLSGSFQYASCTVLPAPLAMLPYLRAFGGTGAGLPNEADAVAFDAAGNLYVSGIFTGTTTFVNSQTLSAVGLGDIFVIKVSPVGEFLWLRRFGGPGDDNTFASAMDVDGNLILSGAFSDTVDFGGITLTSQGGSDQFLLKMSPDGDVIWAKNFGGPADDGGNEVAVDPSGNIIASAISVGTYTAGGFTFQNGGSQDSYVLKLSPGGDVIWVRGTSSANKERIRGVSVDASGNIYGGFEYWNKLIIANQTFTAPNRFFSDGLVVKWDADGVLQWAKSVSGGGDDNVRGIAQGPMGSIYVSGTFGSNANVFGRSLTNAGGPDTYVARLNAADGSIRWLATLASPDAESGGELASAANGVVAVSTVLRNSSDTIVKLDEVYLNQIPRRPNVESLLILFNADGTINSHAVTNSTSGAVGLGAVAITADGTRVVNGIKFGETLTFESDVFTNPAGGEGFVIAVYGD